MCVPLPPAKKTPPPSGFTGGADKNPKAVTAEWVEYWAEPGHFIYAGEGLPKFETAQGNLGFVLRSNDPDYDFVGIDVDAYVGKTGAEALAELEKLAGEQLPANYRSSGRGKANDISGIRIFRAPSGLWWPGNLDDATGIPGIDIIKGAHRYVVLPPSIHPDTGKPYRWNTSIKDFLSDDADFPELPTAFVELITGGRAHVERASGPQLSKSEQAEWIANLPSGVETGSSCKVTQDWLAQGIDNLAVALDGGIHDASEKASFALLRAGAEGHSGVPEALEQLRTAHLAARKAAARGESSAASEWSRLVEKNAISRAIAQTEAEGKAAEKCFCDDVANSPWGKSFEEEPEADEWVTAQTKRASRLAAAQEKSDYDDGVQGMEFKCPNKTGPHTIIGNSLAIRNGLYFECKSWRCAECAEVKIGKIKENLDLHCRSLGHRDTLHVVMGYRHAEAISNRVTRTKPKPNTLKISIRDRNGKAGVLLVSSVPVKGHGWATEEMGLDAVKRLIDKRPDDVTYTGTRWSGEWKLEAREASITPRLKHNYGSAAIRDDHFRRAGLPAGAQIATEEQVEKLLDQLSTDASVEAFRKSRWAL